MAPVLEVITSIARDLEIIGRQNLQVNPFEGGSHPIDIPMGAVCLGPDVKLPFGILFYGLKGETYVLPKHSDLIVIDNPDARKVRFPELVCVSNVGSSVYLGKPEFIEI